MATTLCMDCRGTLFVEFHGDLTCRGCGLVKHGHMFSDEYDWNAHETTEEYVQEYNSARHKDRDYFLFDKINAEFDFPQNVFNLGKDMYYEFKKKNPFKGDDKKMHAIIVCMHFAAKYMKCRTFSKTDACYRMSLSIKLFSQMYTNVHDVLHGTEYSEILGSDMNICVEKSHIQDNISNVIQRTYMVDKEKRFDVKKTILKFHERLNNHKSLIGFSMDKLMATLVYMSCMYLRMNVTMRHVAETTGTSVTTIIQIEKLVKNILH
jgi:transcription initiation factor TFIIIB Brf1 subunit/transcription initiation factor TFIIB